MNIGIRNLKNCNRMNCAAKRKEKMEGYIKRLNHKVLKKYDKEGQKKVKRKYQLLGGFILGVGLAGLVASFVTFMILFFNFKTDEAMIAWIVAVPFVLLIVAGSVLARIADMLLKDFVEKEYQADKERKKKKKV